MPVHIIKNQASLDALRSLIRNATASAVASITDLVATNTPIAALAAMKFGKLGFHPIEPRRLNLIEQVNQTFTYLVSLAAAEQILLRHPGSAPLHLNLGTSAGSDLES